MSKFKFDFDAVKGMEFTDAFTMLFKQMEDHYNANFSAPKLVFGAGASPELTAEMLRTEPRPMVVPEGATLIDPDTIAAPAPVDHGPVDTEKITKETIAMKTFAIKDGKDLGLKEGDAMLKGIGTNSKGIAVEVFDKLLPGYDQEPYGPVVQGESGRYNPNPKGK